MELWVNTHVSAMTTTLELTVKLKIAQAVTRLVGHATMGKLVCVTGSSREVIAPSTGAPRRVAFTQPVHPGVNALITMSGIQR